MEDLGPDIFLGSPCKIFPYLAVVYFPVSYFGVVHHQIVLYISRDFLYIVFPFLPASLRPAVCLALPLSLPGLVRIFDILTNFFHSILYTMIR